MGRQQLRPRPAAGKLVSRGLRRSQPDLQCDSLIWHRQHKGDVGMSSLHKLTSIGVLALAAFCPISNSLRATALEVDSSAELEADQIVYTGTDPEKAFCALECVHSS